MDENEKTIHDSIAAVAKFATITMVMIVRHLEKNGALPRGAIEGAIRDLLDANKDVSVADWEQKLSLHFFTCSLESFERNKDWPVDGAPAKPYTLH